MSGPIEELGRPFIIKIEECFPYGEMRYLMYDIPNKLTKLQQRCYKKRYWNDGTCTADKEWIDVPTIEE